MNAADVFPRLTDPRPMMLCRRLSDDSSDPRLYRVPIEHRRLAPLSPESLRLLDELPKLPSFEQLRAVLADGCLGLFVPSRLSPDSDDQEALGAIILLPPIDW